MGTYPQQNIVSKNKIILTKLYFLIHTTALVHRIPKITLSSTESDSHYEYSYAKKSGTWNIQNAHPFRVYKSFLHKVSLHKVSQIATKLNNTRT